MGRRAADNVGGAGRAPPLVGGLERRSGASFAVAGVLLAAAAMFHAVTAFTPATVRGPLTFVPEFFGPIVAYLGLLGLFPRVAHSMRRVALGCLVILSLPIAATLVALVFFLVGTEPEFIVELLLVIYLGYGIGVAAFGSVIVLTGVTAQSIGLALLVYAGPWFGLAAVEGRTASDVDTLVFGTMAVGLLAAAWLIAREPGPRLGLAPIGDDRWDGRDDRRSRRRPRGPPRR